MHSRGGVFIARQSGKLQSNKPIFSFINLI
jgi:hypothetical protein